MKDTSSKDSTEMLEELSKHYGCYGVTSVVGFGTFIDQWHANGGEDGALDGARMIINTATGKFDLWIQEIFNNEK